MPVVYEWWAEEIDGRGDVVQVHFYDKRADAEAHEGISSKCVRVRVQLTRSIFDNEGDLKDRQFAAVIDGYMPRDFDGGAKVPNRLRPVV
jgi:hypothetical protein